MAVPHVHRPKQEYLLATLSSLFSSMTPTEKRTTVVVVMVAEPWNEEHYDLVVEEIKTK